MHPHMKLYAAYLETDEPTLLAFVQSVYPAVTDDATTLVMVPADATEWKQQVGPNGKSITVTLARHSSSAFEVTFGYDKKYDMLFIADESVSFEPVK